MSATPKVAAIGGAPRFINPNSPLQEQITTLRDLIKSPPENSRIISFCPALAQWVLDELNLNNRKAKPARIKRYSAAMEDEVWVLSGDTIKFGKTKLLDGQNRLKACALTGKMLRTHVIFGIDEAAFAVIDSGKARTPGDTMFVGGVPYADVVASAVRWLMLYDKKEPDLPPDRGMGFSNQEMLAYWNQKVNKELLGQAVERTVASSKLIPRGILAAHLYLFAQKHPATAKRFSDDLARNLRVGVKLPKAMKTLRTARMGRLHEHVSCAMIINAWNAYRANKQLTEPMLRWTSNKEYPNIA